MNFSRAEILDLMENKRYPLSSKYDPDWILENAMGSHCLWLLESLAQAMDLKPGMRVLDMGCGKAIGSVFLAKEFGVQVWAADLRIDPTDNWKRICAKSFGSMVCPVRADANDLPFADGYFDAMVSINSLFIYATGETFFNDHLLRNVRPGGEIGFVVPSFMREYGYGGSYPESYGPYVEGYGLKGWHTAAWWKDRLERTGLAEVIVADNLADDDGADVFRKSAQMFNAHEEPFNRIAWDDITFARIVAVKK